MGKEITYFTRAEKLPDFRIDWEIVMKADGFYFTARYPGDDAIEVTKDDVKNKGNVKPDCFAKMQAAWLFRTFISAGYQIPD